MAEGAAIDVRGGETTVVELVATPSQGSTNSDAAERSWAASVAGIGSLEIQLIDEQGQPVAAGPILYLLASNGKVIEVPIDRQGHGSLDQVPAGDYELSLQAPSANPKKDEQRLGQLLFGLGQTKLPGDALVTIRKILDSTESLYASKQGIYRLTAHGYADNTPDTTTKIDYALERAKSAKDGVEQERALRKLSWLEVAMDSHGEQPGDAENERKQNRRVDFVLRPPQSS
jgi:outer membrane protein OmpA-like peptidoglycan-associated protein